MPDQHSLPPPLASSDSAPPPLASSSSDHSQLSPSNTTSPTFRFKRKPVPSDSTPLTPSSSIPPTSPETTSSTSGSPANMDNSDPLLVRQLRTSAYVDSQANKVKLLPRSGSSSPGRPMSAILTKPTPPPRTSSAVGLGISSPAPVKSSLAPIELAPAVPATSTTANNGTALHGKTHYLMASRSIHRSGSLRSGGTSEAGGSPLQSPTSDTFPAKSPLGSPHAQASQFDHGGPSPTTPTIDVHLSEKPIHEQAVPPSSAFHPLNHLKESELNKTLPSLPPPSIYDSSSGKAKSTSSDTFSVDALPEPMRLWEASQCYVTDELGRPRKFGEFWDRTDIKLDPDMYAKKVSVEKAYRKKEAKEAKRSGGSNASVAGRSEAGSIRSAGSSQSIRTLSTRGSTPSRSSTPFGSRPGTPASRSNSQTQQDRRESAATIRAGTQRADINEPAEIKCGGEEHNAPGRRTVVFWIRHFWCGQCQDYTFASLSLLDPEAINAAGLNVIVISNGSWKIIRRYRELFKCPYPIYVDGSRRLYQLMGMTKLTNDFGPMRDRAAYNRAGAPMQLARGVGNALFKMPIADPGKLTQLGGEFVLGPGLQCTFAHRMTNTSNHLEAYDVMTEAGCDSCTIPSRAARALAREEMDALAQLQREEAEWREDRSDELRRMQASKAERRGAPQYAESLMSEGTGLEDRRTSSISGQEGGENGETSRKGSVATIPGVQPIGEEQHGEARQLSEADQEERRGSALTDVSGHYGEHAFSPAKAAFIAEYSKSKRSADTENANISEGGNTDDRSISSHSTDAFAFDGEGADGVDSIAHLRTDEDGRSSYAGDADFASSGRLSKLTLEPGTPITRSERWSGEGFGGAGGLRKLSAFGMDEGFAGGKSAKASN